MSQKDLARQLGVAESTLSAWAKAGAPVAAGADAVRRWRNSNRRPYVPSTPTPAARAAAAAVAGAPAGPADDGPAAIADELEARLRQAAMMGVDEALVVLSALAAAGAARLTAGLPLGDLEAPIRAALRAIPMDRRAEVAIPASVFHELCRDVVEAVEGSFVDPDAREADRRRYEAGGQAEAARMGELWYSIAAGELVLDLEARS